MKLDKRVWLVALLISGLACKGSIEKGGSGNPGSGGDTGGGAGTGPTGNGGAGGDDTPPPPPFEVVNSAAAIRKVKNLLTGLAPTDAEVMAAGTTDGLRTLITTWTTGADTKAFFQDKMMFFFRNAFQQTGFTPTEDFKIQLLQNGGFDFGPLGLNAVGDDAFARIVMNIQDSFAMTAWQTVAEGRPFTDVLTTQRFMMTTALKSLYLMIEMPNDQPFAFGGGGKTCASNADCAAPLGCNLGANVGQTRTSGTCQLAWKIDMSGNPIALTDSLNPASPNYMVFDDQAPVVAKPSFGGGGMGFMNCHGTATVDQYYGYSQLFQRYLGMTQRYPFVAMNACIEHASRPIFTTTDLSDWQWVNVRALKSGETRLQPFDLPTLRPATELALQLPRQGFFTTPAFLALWNTNDSNQHRVTANQTLMVAFGQALTSSSTIVPLSTAGLDPSHAVTGSECYGCHKVLDPLRQFWANQFDYNDRNDFPKNGTFNGGVANPRPATTGGALAFLNINTTGNSLLDLGPLLTQVTDNSDGNGAISRFALAMAQKLCYYANSSGCVESDPEFRRIATAFQTSNFNFLTLVQEMFSSPLVTATKDTATFDQLGVTISVSRRNQLCQALSNRLGMTDICALAASAPTTAQSATLKIATSVAADAFSRGSEVPVTPSVPTVFFRAATEMLCENVASLVVDATGGNSVWSSTNVAPAIDDMVTRIIGYPPSDSHHAMAAQILQDHYNAVMAVKPNTATNALRSTFALACQAPTSVSIGL